MTTPAPTRVHPRSPFRLLKTSMLVLMFVAGIGAIAVTAAAKTFTDDASGMAGYA